MKELIDKITSYNLFNYLLPGVLFVTIVNQFTTYSFIQDNLFVGAFIYYFIGLAISRFGSLVVEPILKKISFLQFASYSDFVSASKKDSNIEMFSEINNMYRTFVAMFILIGLLKFYELLKCNMPQLGKWDFCILILLLLIIFIFSYKKQTDYIRKRIEFIK